MLKYRPRVCMGTVVHFSFLDGGTRSAGVTFLLAQKSNQKRRQGALGRSSVIRFASIVFVRFACFEGEYPSVFN